MQIVAVLRSPLAPMRHYQLNGIAQVYADNFIVLLYGEKYNLSQKHNVKFRYQFINTYRIIFKRKNSYYTERWIDIPLGLINKLLKGKPTLILSSEFSFPSLICLIYKIIFNCRLIIHIEGTIYSERGITKLQNIIRKFFIKHSDGFLAVGKQSKKYLQSIGGTENKIWIAPQATDTTLFANIAQEIRVVRNLQIEPLRLVYVGQLIERKGLNLLINAIDYYNRNYGEIELWIIGEGDEYKNLIYQVENKYLTKKIIFYGYVDNLDLPKYYAQCDIFAFPSLEDTYAVVIAEAMACGLPAICNLNVGAIDDLIVEGKTGYTVDYFDTIEVAKKIHLCKNNIVSMQKNIKNVLNDWDSNVAVRNIIASFKNERHVE